MPRSLSKRASPCSQCDLEPPKIMLWVHKPTKPYIWNVKRSRPPGFKPNPCQMQLHYSFDHLTQEKTPSNNSRISLIPSVPPLTQWCFFIKTSEEVANGCKWCQVEAIPKAEKALHPLLLSSPLLLQFCHQRGKNYVNKFFVTKRWQKSSNKRAHQRQTILRTPYGSPLVAIWSRESGKEACVQERDKSPFAKGLVTQPQTPSSELAN